MKSYVSIAFFACVATMSATCRDFPVDAPAGGVASGARIQKAIDDANAAGGGRVVVRKGVHPCGTIYLKSNVELHLEKDAVLLGGEKPGDYDDVVDPLTDIAPEKSSKVFLACIDATNVSVTGSGVIDGKGVSFYDPVIKPPARFFKKPPIPRPRMVQFFRVSNVRFEGVTLKDSPGWTVWLRECEDIAFERVKIVGDQRMINNDGIDFDGCRRMSVVDCDITTGDDCLVMRAMRSGGRPIVCEDLTVRNCRLSSACQGVRLGCPSDDTIRNARFENCTFKGNNGIMSQHPYCYLHPDDEGYCRMANISFSGWEMECSSHPIFLMVEGGIRIRDFGHVTFKDMKIKAKRPILLLGSAESPLRDVRFENITAEISEGEPIKMNATEQISFDRFNVTSGPGKPQPFVRKQGPSWETKPKPSASSAEKREVKVSDFGFDREDSTAFLQKAFDSGARRVVIDRQAGPWVTRPLSIRRRNLEIVFEPGVEIVAKKGEFKAIGDALINAGRGIGLKIRGNGATLRMHRADYMKKPYARSEWRHALVFTNAKDVLVENLRIVDSGGDAIYLGGTPDGACENVVIRGVAAIGNVRQGISVISAENLLIEDCTFENTCGLPPMAGIDFEPNLSGQRLVNCTVRNCVSRQNLGFGWDVALFSLNSGSRPVSILFDGCREEDNNGSLHVWCENRTFDNVRGTVRFRNCSFARPRINTFSFAQNPDFPLELSFEGCRYLPKDGTAAVDVPDWKSINISPALSGSNAKVSVVKNPDMSKAVVRDTCPGEMVPLSPFNIRFGGHYRFYADRAREVRFRGRQLRIGNGKQGATESGFVLKDASGKVVSHVDMPKFDEAEFKVAVPAAGFYTLDFNAQPSPFALTASDAPVAVDLEKRKLSVINSSGRLYFTVVDGTDAFAVIAAGSASERIRVRLFAPDGTVAWDCDGIDRTFRHTISSPMPGMWTLLASKPTKGGFEDYGLDLAGIPGHLFLCKGKTWDVPAMR